MTVLCFTILLQTACGAARDGKDANETPASPGVTIAAPGGFSNAAQSTGASENDFSETITLRLMYDAPEAETDPLADQVLDKFNIQIIPLPFPEGTEPTDAILSASGDTPDLWLTSLTPPRLAAWITNGHIRDISAGMMDGYTLLGDIIHGDATLAAYSTLYGGGFWYMPRVNDRNPAYAADTARIFFRKDRADQLSISVPETTEDFYGMLKAFAESRSQEEDETGAVALAVDSADVFPPMFGYDPERWIWEDDRYIPAYYSDRMLIPLAFARKLYEEGLLVFNSGDGESRTLNEADVLITDGGNALSFTQVLSPVAKTMGITETDVYERYVGVMDIPHADEGAVWRYHDPTEGWVVRMGLPDEYVERILSLFEYSLTDEARMLARYGLPGVTYAETKDGAFLFTDPETNRAYDLADLNPTGGFLHLITNDYSWDTDPNMPSQTAPALRLACAEITEVYSKPVDRSADALCRIVYTNGITVPQIDYNLFFYFIITADEPLESIFGRFQEECRKQGLDEAINAVTEAVRIATGG